MRNTVLYLLFLSLFFNCRKKETDNPVSTNTNTNTTDTIPKVDTPKTKKLLYIGETKYYSDYYPGYSLPDSVTVVYTFDDSSISFSETKYNILNSKVRYKHPYPHFYFDTLEPRHPNCYIINNDSLTAINSHTDGMGGITSYTFKGKKQ